MSPANLQSFLKSRRAAVFAGILAGATVAAYWPVSHFDITNYDDRNILFSHPLVAAGLTLRGFSWALTNSWFEYWHPLTWLSHMLDFELFGSSPGRHHLVSLGFHVANSMLLFAVLRRMTGAFWRSALVSSLFALHPQHVESVAWLAERKDVLSGFFFMLVLWAYCRFAEARHSKSEARYPEDASRITHDGSRITHHASCFYLLSLAFFACGLMSKPMVVTVPFVLLLLDCWPLNRVDRHHFSPRALLPLIAEKVPFLILTVASCAITYAWAVNTGNTLSADEQSWGLRLANLPVSYARYLGKMIWPVDLAVLYPMASHWSGWQVGGATALLVLITLCAGLRVRSSPYLAVGWLIFLGMLLPTLRLFQSGAQAIADRYTYIPSIGVFIAVVWGGGEVLRTLRMPRLLSCGAAGAVLVMCFSLTREQVYSWRDGVSLWQHALAVAQNNDVAQHNLGCALAEQGRFEDAIPHYEEAIRINPARADTHSALAYAFAQQGEFTKARREYGETLRWNPNDAEAHNNLGSFLLKEGRTDTAISHYREALRLKPDDPEAHANLALALVTCGRYGPAAAHLREVLRLNPGDDSAAERLEAVLAAQEKLGRDAEPYRKALHTNPDDARAHAELGRVLLAAGQVDEAIDQCSEAARREPRNAAILYQLGVALARKGDDEKASHRFESVLELDASFAPAHYALGIINRKQGRMADALQHWRHAARLAPAWADPLNNLAWALATNPTAGPQERAEAIEAATRAVALAGTNQVGVLDTLAAAYAATKRFPEAVATARRAEEMAVAQRQADMIAPIRRRLALYGAGQAYTEDPNAK